MMEFATFSSKTSDKISQYVSCSGSITSAGEERAKFSAIVYLWFLFGGVSASSWCLGWAALFYCGTSRAFKIIIFMFYYLLTILPLAVCFLNHVCLHN